MEDFRNRAPLVLAIPRGGVEVGYEVARHLDEVKRLVEEHGGRATSSVSGETDYVVAGPGAGSKLDEAQEHNVPVLDEEEFISMLERN